MTALIAALFTTSSAWALPSCPVYPATISACCVADQPGQIYEVGTDLAATNSCIKISAPNVDFELNGKDLKGPGKGIGIHVLSTAANAFVESDDPAPLAVVVYFAIGFKTDAPNTFVYGVTANYNHRGMVFNGQGATGIGIFAEHNLGSGIVLTPAASGSYFDHVEPRDNGKNGIVLKGTTGVAIRNCIADENNGYGLWLEAASSNFVLHGELEGNGIAGAYLGCHANGPSPAGCSIQPSNHNSIDGGGTELRLTVGSCPGGRQTDQPYGIAIDEGNRHNHVTGVATDTSTSCTGPGDTAYDGYDGNGGHCGGNAWLSNDLAHDNHLPLYYGCMH